MSINSVTKKFYSLVYAAFRRDIGRKLMALLLAILVWVYVAQKVVNRVEHDLTISVVTGRDAFIEEAARLGEGFFIILPENLMEVRSTEDESLPEDLALKVTLSGPAERLPAKLIGSYEIIAPKHLGDRDVNTVSITILKELFKDLAQANGIRVAFEPATIEVRLARREEINISLDADNLIVEGQPPEGIVYEPAAVTFDPQLVRLSGPAPQIDRIREDSSRFVLEPIDLKDAPRGSSIQLGASADMKKKAVSMMTLQGVVSVNLHLREKEETLDLPAVPVVLLDYGKPLSSGEQADAVLDAKTVDLQLKGSPSALRSFTAEQLKARIIPVIDLKGQREANTYDIQIWRQGDLPPSIRISLEDDDAKMAVRFLDHSQAEE